jgi:hypothetical protein
MLIKHGDLVRSAAGGPLMRVVSVGFYEAMEIAQCRSINLAGNTGAFRTSELRIEPSCLPE